MGVGSCCLLFISLAPSSEKSQWGLHPTSPWEKAMQRQHGLGKPSAGACTPRGFMVQQGRGKLRGQKEKVRTRGKRQKEGTAGAISPLASPSGLKEAVGVTVLVESMKLREAQKIPDRTLLSSFQDLSTLDGDTNPLTVAGLPLLPPSKPAAGRQTIRLAS